MISQLCHDLACELWQKQGETWFKLKKCTFINQSIIITQTEHKWQHKKLTGLKPTKQTHGSRWMERTNGPPWPDLYSAAGRVARCSQSHWLGSAYQRPARETNRASKGERTHAQPGRNNCVILPLTPTSRLIKIFRHTCPCKTYLFLVTFLPSFLFN